MIDRQNLNLTIDHIDPLGQGVAKIADKIYFVPKTLPGELVEVQIVNKSKGVHFCQLIKVIKPAPNRVEPACPHYETCRGCHFQHTDNQSEIIYKETSLKRTMEKFSTAPIEIKTIASQTRDSYRNRIQLHYSTRHRLIGFHDPRGRIIPIQNCMIAEVQIQNYLKGFLIDWISIIPKSEPHMGHVEISLKNEHVVTNWNKNYASDGFTQVHSVMNLRMQDQIMHSIHSRFNRPISILDLFSGNGNLSNRMNCFKRWMVDSTQYEHADFYQANLFELTELSRLKKNLPNKVDVILVDPPRQGFEHIPAWIEQIEANYLIYISCHYHTMARDLARIQHKIQIQDIFLLDMFPSTHHFESMCIVKLS